MDVATFNGISKIVTLTVTGQVSVRSLYSSWVRWAALNPGYTQCFDTTGGTVIDPIKGTYQTVYVTLLNGWKVVAIGDTEITDGILMVDGGASAPFISQTGQTLIKYSQPIVTESFATGSSSGGGTSGLPAAQLTMLTEIYALLGLDPTKPLVVTTSSIDAGTGIHQNITGDNTKTTVTRT